MTSARSADEERLPPFLQTEARRIDRLGRMNRGEEDNLRRLLAFVLRSDGNGVDVGAHGGAVLREMCRVAPSGRHIAVEPIPRLARLLRRLYPGVEVLEMALSDGAGEADFVHVTSLPSWSGLLQRPYPPRIADSDLEHITVTRSRLDDVLPTGYVPHLLKIDVEGGELAVLRGARQTLLQHRPVVVFELSLPPAAVYGWGASDIHRFLVDEVGMHIFDLDGDGPYSEQELIEAAEHDLHRNYVARP